ncbi:hypothetical protein [Sulfitobacter sp.]|uniref:hypothetical protein n=1 Tax=Sulfitobacter sp. TaxID=1903071 RepID=UPI00356382F8
MNILSAQEMAFTAITLGIGYIFAYAAAFGLLCYCLATSRDYRRRCRFSGATRDLELSDLEDALCRNMLVISTFLHGPRKPGLEARKAESALVMATVLREHIARKNEHRSLPRYLKVRRTVWNEASTTPPENFLPREKLT